MVGMTVSAANHIANLQETTDSKKTSPFEAQQSFATVLKDSINSLNTAQVQSDQLTQKMANGENVDLHTVMIASQKASITMSATLEIRNKVVEAYQEMMRMNI